MGAGLGPGAWRLRLVALLGVVLIAAALLIVDRPFILDMDDAYITAVNARALLAGVDPNYGAPALAGATSLFDLAGVALLSLVMSPPAACALFGVLGAIAYLQAVVSLAASYRLTGGQVAILLLLAGFTGFVALQLFNGLETAWGLAAATALIVLARRKSPTRWLAALAGLAPFIRPELAVLAALLGARQAWLRWRSGRARALPAISLDLAVALAAAAPWLAWQWFETGQFVVTTAAAKEAFYAGSAGTFLQRLPRLVALLPVVLGPAVLLVPFARRTSLALALWMFGAVFLAIYWLWFPIEFTGYSFRHDYTLLPVCLWAVCETAEAGGRAARLVIIAALAWTVPSAAASAKAFGDGLAICRDSLALAAWADRALPPGAPVMVLDAGAIAWGSHLKLVDMVGLKTPSSVASQKRWTLASGGRLRGRALAEIARRQGVRYVVAFRGPGYAMNVPQALSAEGYRLSLVRPSPRKRFGYDLFSLAPP